jgi:GMP synthase (glutamine-hydrolysing)
LADKEVYALQFHPEVAHTKTERDFENFVFNVCKCKPKWTMQSFIETTTKEIKKIIKSCVRDKPGVDSAVTAVLINKAIGNSLPAFCG